VSRGSARKKTMMRLAESKESAHVGTSGRRPGAAKRVRLRLWAARIAVAEAISVALLCAAAATGEARLTWLALYAVILGTAAAVVAGARDDGEDRAGDGSPEPPGT
jgi:hypothetical protein